jgi:hypothetical protein
MASRNNSDEPRPASSRAASSPANPAKPAPRAKIKTAPGAQEGLSDDDLRDIEGLLDQSPDLTRQDLPAQSLEQLLESFQKKP